MESNIITAASFNEDEGDEGKREGRKRKVGSEAKK
jgi:hypothetical protein